MILKLATASNCQIEKCPARWSCRLYVYGQFVLVETRNSKQWAGHIDGRVAGAAGPRCSLYCVYVSVQSSANRIEPGCTWHAYVNVLFRIPIKVEALWTKRLDFLRITQCLLMPKKLS